MVTTNIKLLIIDKTVGSCLFGPQRSGKFSLPNSLGEYPIKF